MLSSGQPVGTTAAPVASPGAAGLTGLPGNPSRDDTLNVTVSGDNVKSYTYALVDSTSCSGVTYSDSVDVSTAITASIGADGVKALCVLASVFDGTELVVSALSYTWLKDSTAPTASFAQPSGFGPAFEAGSAVTINLMAADGGTGVSQILVSVQSGSGAHSCLNAARSAFDAGCPTWVQASPAGGAYALSINDSAFTNGETYQFSGVATDLSGNTTSPVASMTLTWDSTAPSAPSTLTATAGSAQVSLSWSAVSGARYVVMRKEGSAVDEAAPAGAAPSVGMHVGGGNFVACVGTATSCVDANLDAFAWYHYQVFALDAAGNVSIGGGRASAQPGAAAAFKGLTNAYVWGPGRRVAAEWQKFTPAGGNAATMSYGVFTASNSGGQDFMDDAANGLAKESLSFVDGGSSSNLYLIGRQTPAGGTQDDNTRELRLKLGAGVHHKIAANGRFLGLDPLGQAYLRSAWSVAVDPYGNTVFSGQAGTVDVLCSEVTQATYCKSRSLGRIYTIAGKDGADDGADGAIASATAMGDAWGITFDSYGNMYLADSTYFRVRAVCYNPLAPGFCNSKTPDYLYNVAGIGASADGLSDVAAKNTGIGQPYAVQVNAGGDIFVGDGTFYRIRAICYDTEHGYCNGKVAGNIYNVSGTGVLGDGGDNVPAANASTGSPRGLALDAQGNLWFADYDYRRVRALCLKAAGWCAARTVGNMYRAAGTGVAGDGADNAVAGSTAMGQSQGIAVSAAGNVYVTDATYFRVRVVCVENTADHFCQGKNVGNVYRIAGIGTNVDGASGSLALSVAIGDPRNIAVDANGNLLMADNIRRRIRVLCAGDGGVCDGKLADYHYWLVGSGATTMGWQLPALQTPVGTPQALGQDSYGNVFVADSANFAVRVICYDTGHAGFCSGRTAGYSYLIAGTGVTGNSVDNVLAIASPIGAVNGLTVDGDGNVFLVDGSYPLVRVICGNVSGSGWCTGKTAGNMYRLAGTGASADGADNSAFSAGMGTPGGLTFDSSGNLWVADSQYFRVRALCLTTAGWCAGKTLNNGYRVAGTGVTGDGANAGTAASTAMGAPTAIELDPWNNVLLGDSTYFRVRVICYSTAGGFCVGKTVGSVYRAAGTGVTGDGANDSVASTTAVGITYGIATDAQGNIYLADTTYRRIRALCVDVSSHYCSGLTAGNSYRMFGTGVLGDSSSGTDGALVRLDTPTRDSMLLNATGGYFVFVGSSGAVRMFINY